MLKLIMCQNPRLKSKILRTLAVETLQLRLSLS